MIVTDLLDCPVHDAAGVSVGYVVDVRLVLDQPPDAGGRLAVARLHGLVVSPRTRTSFLGFERSGATSPWPVAQLLRWWHRGTFLVHWPDVASVPTPRDVRDAERAEVVVLRSGYTRYDPVTPAS